MWRVFFSRFHSLARTYRSLGVVVTNGGLLEESVEREEVLVAGRGGEGLDLDGSGFEFGGRLWLGEGKQVSPLCELFLGCLAFFLGCHHLSWHFCFCSICN